MPEQSLVFQAIINQRSRGMKAFDLTNKVTYPVLARVSPVVSMLAAFL